MAHTFVTTSTVLVLVIHGGGHIVDGQRDGEGFVEMCWNEDRNVKSEAGKQKMAQNNSGVVCKIIDHRDG